MRHQTSVALMKFLSAVARKLGVAEHIYVVGGAVRNFVMDPTGSKYPIKDIDVVIDSVALKGRDSAWFAKQLVSAIPAATSLVTNNYGVAIITINGDWILGGSSLKGEVVEIANARKESYGEAGGKGYKPHMVEPAAIEQDVMRREFSFNTLLWRLLDLAHGPDKAEIIDLTGCGLRDLKNKEMLCPRDPDIVFKDDPSRMIRVVKFLLKYGFKIPPDVKASIKRNSPKLKNIPSSHLSNMLINTFFEPGVGKQALLEMKRLGLLDTITEIARTDKAFQAALAHWANKNASIQFVFDLMDLGMPSGKRISFLDTGQQKRLRELTVQMSADESDAYVRVLEQPGKVLDMPALIAEFGLTGVQIRTLLQTAREVLLEKPNLIKKTHQLEDAVRLMMNYYGKKANLSGIVEVPKNTHPVTVDPPKPPNRKKYPFVGFIDFQGLEIDVENKKGDTRKGENSDGTEWATYMHNHYGEIRGTEGTDGDKLDAYVGPNHDSSLVVVVHQNDPETGKFDEDKVMLGFDSTEEAIGAYKKQYDQPGFFKEDEYLEMPIGQFWRWVHEERNKGNPTVVVEPQPKGRKQPKEFGLYRLWQADPGKRLAPAQKVAATKLSNRYLSSNF